MYCQECGKAIPNDSKFCPECGTNQEIMPVENLKKQCNISQNTKKKLSLEKRDNNTKRNKIICTAVGSMVAIGVTIGVISLFMTPTINLNKYVTISTAGYNTVGKAVAVFDKEKFENDYEESLSANIYEGNKSFLSGFENEEDYLEAWLDLYDDSSASSTFLLNCVYGSISEESGLSNGDTITYTWECEDELALENYGYKLKYSEIKYTVSGLEEVEIFDPFEGFDVVFEGVGPNGIANISGESVYNGVDNLYYYIEPSNGLSNGDTVKLKVTLPYDGSVDYCVENYGKIPSPMEKEFTVDGLGSYVTSASEISSETMKSMQEQAVEIAASSISDSWDVRRHLRAVHMSEIIF